MSIHKTIKEGRLRLRMSERDFAQAVGVSRSAVQSWEKPGGTAPSRARQARVADLLGISVAELMGRGPRAVPGATRRATVPLLDDAEAGDFKEIDNFSDVDGHEIVEVSVPVQRHTFALRVRGDSMISETGDSIPEGSVIVIEPAIRAAEGDFVVVLQDERIPDFKMLASEDGCQVLKPLNPRYPSKPLGAAAILGVVREVRKRFR